MNEDFLDALDRQLVEATERGRKRPRRRWPHPRSRRRLHPGRGVRVRVPTVAFVVTAMTALTATALAAELGLPVVRPHQAAPVTRPAARSLAHRSMQTFEPQSFTAIGEFTWWLLGTRGCGGARCVAVVGTQDGGRSFRWIPAPTLDPGAVSQLRFANAKDGYAFGPQLWSTHDGGRDWQRIRVGGRVSELMASGAYVYAIVQPRKAGPGRLMRSTVGRDQWVTLPAAKDLQNSLWVQGPDVLVESFGGPTGGELLSSADDGASFTAHPAPGSQCAFEQAQAGVLWAPCTGGLLSGLARSSDGGATYTDIDRAAVAARGRPFSSSTAFAAAGDEVAVLGDRQLYRTVDGGRSFTRVPTPRGVGGWQYLGFTDATHGVALGSFGAGSRLYYTINAGASYHYVPIDPGPGPGGSG